MNSRYVERTDAEIRNLLESEMGFAEVDYNDSKFVNTFERVYHRDVVTSSGVCYPYEILVYTSVDRSTNVTRSCASDAIRIVLLSTETGNPLKRGGARVYRTKNALSAIKERCREVFRFIMTVENHCVECSGMMDIRVVKSGTRAGTKFLGCSNFPSCHHTEFVV